MTQLTKREFETLSLISAHTRAPTKERRGYSKHWTPKTWAKLQRKGLVECVWNSVVITEAGLEVLNKP